MTSFGKFLKGAISIVIAIVWGLGINYIVMPDLSLRSIEFWFFAISICTIAAVVSATVDLISEGKVLKFSTSLVGIIVLLCAVICIGKVSSLEFWNATKYHNLVEITQGNFEEDIPKVTDETVPIIVDVGTAQNLGDRATGTIKNATWYEVDQEYNLIKYKNGYYRISELNYGDSIWKYFKAKETGIPGYVLVNALNQEAKYVELDEPIRYSPSAFFSYKLERHLKKQFIGYILGTSFFEIDEEGTPYYITSVKTPTIGLFGGIKEDSFIITNASSGESKEYKTNELPDWVDHAYDLDYLMKVVDYNQKYIDGWLNTKMSQTGINATTYQYIQGGYNTTITSEGDIVFYTGVTPVNNTEANIGFILANMRTGEIKFYECAGAEESSAKTAASGLVQDLKYYTTFPTILNIDGLETYFMLLKDQSGLVKRYALCNIEDYSIVVQATDFQDAVELYRKEVRTKQVLPIEPEETFEIKGVIKELYEAQIDGSTYYYFTLEGSNDLYMSSIKNSNRQVLLKKGTKVSVKYSNTTEDKIYLVNNIQF